MNDIVDVPMLSSAPSKHCDGGHVPRTGSCIEGLAASPKSDAAITHRLDSVHGVVDVRLDDALANAQRRALTRASR